MASHLEVILLVSGEETIVKNFAALLSAEGLVVVQHAPALVSVAPRYAACCHHLLSSHHFSAPVAIYEPSHWALKDLAMYITGPSDLHDPPLMSHEARWPTGTSLMADSFGLKWLRPIGAGQPTLH